jgi:DNA-binding beta-propeller fold protein YncE
MLALPAVALLAAVSASQPVSDATRWGHEPYAVASPVDVAVSPPDGAVYVACAAEGQVVMLKPDLQPTGIAIAAPGVSGLAVAADGRLAIVTGGKAGQLFVVRQDGEIVKRVGGTDQPVFTDAQGVTWDAAGNLFVFDSGAGRVRVFSTTGEALFDFGDYKWQRRYDSRKQKKRVEEEVTDKLYHPCRGDFLPDGRLIVADYDGPVSDPELNRRAGMYSVWKVDVAAKRATFEQFMRPEDPYPTSQAADVCVDPRTGRIFTAEADFPLTDHDFVRVQDSIDETPRCGTNFFPYRFITHPRGIALAANGDVLVAEADKGQVFAIPRKLFDTRRDDPSPLDWPKILRIPVCERERVVLEYTTLEAALSKVEFAPLEGDWYTYPQPPGAAGRRVAEVPAFTPQGQERQAGEPDVFHRVELTELEPGRRYVCRYLVTDKCYPAPLWSEPFLVATQPPAGQTQYVDAEVIVLVFTNLLDPVDAKFAPEPADPGPMTKAEVDALMYRLEMARRFYWINSRCRFQVHYKYVLEDQRYTPAPVHNYGYWPHDDHQEIDAILARHGVQHARTAGLCTIYGYRHWDDAAKQWVLSGSGGNTWGSIHDGSDINAFSAGGDTAWLFVHEYGHGMGINYQYSGQVFHFNHFHWNFLATHYGAHYDGMAAMCREFSDAAYWANKYGRLVLAADADNDGLPDADERCPVDERRFGSSPEDEDTDDDGLTDREELMTTAGLARYAEAFGMRQIEPVFEPDPHNRDADGDGLLDGEDEYPLYPWEPEAMFAKVRVDGEIEMDEWPHEGFVRAMEDEAINGEVRLAWDFGHLYLGLVQKVQAGEAKPARLYLELDCQNDGMTVGADNLELILEPQAEGRVQIRTKHNDTTIRQKPIWRDNVLPNPRDLEARWTRQDDEYHLEIGIPQTKDAGLDLVRFQRMGFMLQLKPDRAQEELRLFEPQQHFTFQLR